ncbi:MAG: shikimate kinase [Bacteroidales bacterium]
MHSRIYLIGFMGSGKTTHGRKIASMMGYGFVDMDEWIAGKEDLNIEEIFRKYGESYFRELETRAIAEMHKLEKVVIATGGGAPAYGKNMELLKRSGLTIYLKLSPEALLSRLKTAQTKRPLLEGKTEAEMCQTIHEMLEEREVFYSMAHMVIDGLASVNERVVNAIQRRT